MSRIKKLFEQQKQDFEDLQRAQEDPDLPKFDFNEIIIDNKTEFMEGSTGGGVTALPSFDNVAYILLKKDDDLVALLTTDWNQFEDIVKKLNNFIEAEAPEKS